MGDSARSEGRSASIDELKGLAILLVVLFHCTCMLRLPNFTRGHAGADIFLMLSGFALAWTLRDEGGGRFLLRRLATVLPRYWAALALIVLLNGAILGRWDGVSDVGLHALALHAFSAGAFFGVNISWWFIGVIVPLYAVVALLRPWLRAGRIDCLIACGLGLTAAVRLIGLATGSDEIAGHFTGCVPEFFLGLAVGCALRAGGSGLVIATPVAGWAVLSYGLFAGAVDLSLLNNPDPLFALGWGGGYLALTRGGGEGMRRLRRLFASLGTISFEVYLYHQPVLTDYNERLWRWLDHGAKPDGIRLVLGMVAGFALVVGWCLLVRALSRRLFPASFDQRRRFAACALAAAVAWALYGAALAASAG